MPFIKFSCLFKSLKCIRSLCGQEDDSVAERISYFCLARNLIRPLELTHNFTQLG